MAYVVPQVLVFQEFTAVPDELTNPLRAWIAGGHADLHRYAVADEKAEVSLGAYDKDFDAAYDWPGRTAGSVVDADYVKLFIDDAILEYCNLPAGTSGITPLAAVSGENNQISGAAVFADNGTAYPRDLENKASGGTVIKRDVKVGDIVDIDDGEGNSLSTHVRGFVADDVAAVIDPATSDSANKATQAAATPTPTAATANTTTSTLAQAGSYDGLADGDISEVYTVTVRDASSGGDFTTAKVDVVSQSGNDNDLNVTPAGTGSAFSVGSRGLTLTFAQSGGTHDLAVGDKWTVNVSQAFEKAEPVSSGTYTGTEDTTYIVECVEGGTFNSSTTAPKISVSTTTSSDSSPAAVVDDDLVAVDVGTKGVKIKFEGTDSSGSITAITQANPAVITVASGHDLAANDLIRILPETVSGGWGSEALEALKDGADGGIEVKLLGTSGGGGLSFTLGHDSDGDGDLDDFLDTSGDSTPATPGTYNEHGDVSPHLRKGDKWYIPVVAKKAGNRKTLILGHNLSDALQAASDLSLKLSVKKNIEVGKNRDGYAPAINWDTSATQFTSKAGILARDAGYDADTDLAVTAGSLYVEYREWLAALSTTVSSIRDVANLSSIAGPLDPDNPLKWGVSKALANSNGTSVKYSSVADPSSTDSWADALGLVVGRDDVYGLVPLTRTKAVLDLFTAHVNSQSSANAGRWRAAWYNILAVEELALVNKAESTDGGDVRATLDANPADSKLTRVTVTTGNIDFVAKGVAAGDIVRYIFVDDGFGNDSYTEFVVDSVTNSAELILFSAHSEAVSVARRIEVYHNRNKAEVATQVAAAAGAYGNRRIHAVWPDVVDSNPGYFLCAALAGYASGVVPHQGLTNAEISGFTDLTRSVDFFNASHLDTLADSGTWVVTKDNSGSVITRHARTTDNTDLNTSEEVVVRNVDSMSFLFLNRLEQFIGKANVTPSALNLMRVQTVSAIEFLKSNGFVERLGCQLIDGDIVELVAHPLLKDRVLITLSLEIPYPANNIEVHLTV